MAFPSATYNLDGEETQENLSNSVPGTVRLKAQWLIIGENQVLQLTSVERFDSKGRNVIVTNRERWTFAPNGRTLNFELHTTSSGNDEFSHLIFTRLPQGADDNLPGAPFAPVDVDRRIALWPVFPSRRQTASHNRKNMATNPQLSQRKQALCSSGTTVAT